MSHERVEYVAQTGVPERFEDHEPTPARHLIALGVLLLGLLLIWRGWPTSVPSAATPSPPTTQASYSPPALRQVEKALEDIRVGARVVGQNPIRSQAETWEPDAATWKELRLHMRKPSGASVWVTLLRPAAWVESKGAEVGQSINLELPEMGAIGPAEVTHLGPCPEIASGEGYPVVTGTFKHEVDRSSRVIQLRLEGQTEPTGVTDNHPYWSVDRQAFVSAGELRLGETLSTTDGTTRVAAVDELAYSGFLYNLETTEHVYRVGPAGTLVHNECALERFGSELEASRSAGIGGLHVDPKYNGKFKNVADANAVDPSKLGRKNATQFSHKMTYQLKDGARDWLKKNGVDVAPGHDGTYQIPAHLVDEFNKRFVTGVTVTPR